jgi:GNAT superfamily N-acetyltransferase
MEYQADIRLATLGDAESIAELVSALGYPCTTDQMQARLEALAADRGHATFVATIDGDVAGMIGAFICRIYEEDEPVGRIIALSVDGKYRGHGLGRSLVQTAERWFGSQGVRAVLVNSGFDRRDAHDFYERVGYSAKGTSFRKKLSR